MAKLSSLCTLFTDGDWIESKDQSDSGIRLIQTGNIGEGNFLEKKGKEKYISEETFEALKCEEVFPGDILISRLPEPVGRACVIPEKNEKMITAVDCSICRVNEALIDKRYLCYFFQSNSYYQQLENNVTGTTRKRISRKNLGEVEINIPSVTKQQEVIAVLDKVTAIIRGRIIELEELDNLIKSRFVELFGDLMINPYEWPVKKISEVSLLLKSGLSRKLSDDDIGLPVIRSGNIQNGQFVYDDVKYWYKEDPQGSKTEEYILEDGDILVNFINSASQIGKTTIFRNVGRDCIYTTNIFRMRLSANCNEYYYNWFAMSDYYYRQLQNIIQPAVNQASFTTVNFLNLNIPLPPIELQNQFAAFVEQVDKLKDEVQKTLDETQTLFDSLMKEYFG